MKNSSLSSAKRVPAWGPFTTMSSGGISTHLEYRTTRISATPCGPAGARTVRAS